MTRRTARLPRYRGFTIAELAATLAVMAVLAGLATVSFSALRAAADTEAALANVGQVRTAQLRYATLRGAYTPCPNQLEGFTPVATGSADEIIACPPSAAAAPGPPDAVRVTAGPSSAVNEVSVAVGVDQLGRAGTLALVAADGAGGCVGTVSPRYGAAGDDVEVSGSGVLCDARAWLPDGEYAAGPLGPLPTPPDPPPTSTTTTTAPPPPGVPVAGIDAADGPQLADGGWYTCAVDGDGGVWCWGDNADGRLGLGLADDAVVTSPTLLTGLPPATQVAVSSRYACALLVDTTVACWGSNNFGALGAGSDQADSSVPVAVPGLSGVTQVSAGGVEVCAVRTGGELWCWGYDVPALADSQETIRYAPERLTGVPGVVAQVDVGPFATGCAITTTDDYSDGLWCWGYNADGQVGVPSGEGGMFAGLTDLAAAGYVGIADVSAGMRHTCAVADGGYLGCWGAGGLLGDGTETASAFPVLVGGVADPVSVSAGVTHTCAVTASGAVWCWGGNAYGELGDGTTDPATAPVEADVTGVSQVSVGRGFTCAMGANGAASCWGSNTGGQLGDGTTTPSLTPVAVTFDP